MHLGARTKRDLLTGHKLMAQIKILILALMALIILPAQSAQANPHRDRLSDYYTYDNSLLGCRAKNTWSGFHVGISAAYGMHDAGWRDRDGWAAAQSISEEVEGWGAGGHVGYNVQCDELVFGLEGDWSWADLSTSNNYDGNRYTVSSKLNNFATMRGKFGLATDHVLLYVTGGLAYADIERKWDLIPQDPCCSGSYSQGKWGWTGGGGIEIARGDRLKFFAEVLYLDFGDDRHNMADCCAVNNFGFDIDDSVLIARTGVRYHLQHRAVEYVPIK